MADAPARPKTVPPKAHPERPAMVPDEAEYQAGTGWVVASVDEKGRRDGLWQCWGDDGQLKETAEYRDNVRNDAATFFHPNGKKAEEGLFARGERDGVWRTWDPSGRLVREVAWRSGARHGPAVDHAVTGQYQDPDIAIERGTFEDDHACGAWSLLDSQSKTVVRRDFGPRLDDETLLGSPALADEGRPAEDWLLVGEESHEGHRPGEALLAIARATACPGSVKSFLDIKSDIVLPRSDEHAAAVAQEMAEGEASLSVLVSGLLQGGAPAPLLRAMAVRLDQQGRSRAALDLINAAILLEPEAEELLFTRSLVLMSLGLPDLALEDARLREACEPEESRFLAAYAKALFPRFDFWPAREKPKTDYEGLPEAPVQPPAKVRAVFLKYVTRLTALRQAQLAWLNPGIAPDWLLPDLSKLLPRGPVKLQRFDLELENEEGERVEVSIDERLDLPGLGLPDLMRLARADWTALTWLCWACGLEEVALPRVLTPPPDFGQAAGMAVQRLWRARDRRLTGGTMARREKVSGFTWEDTEIDQLHPELVSMPENEYAEMAAMFRWLTEARHESPWQDNLRES
ncbi:MAG: thiol reductase thioredoxin [Deltaproteobacteria bacterium]|nr:thiol reductase thioredoxin [Deltaproteobacteria bacterium]